MEAESVPEVVAFAEPEAAFSDLEAELVGRLLVAAADIAMVVEAEGRIRDVAFGDGHYDGDAGRDWVGRKFSEIVTSECLPKVERMLAMEGPSAERLWHEINHPSDSGTDRPIRYRVVPLSRKGHAIFLGRDLGSVSQLQQRAIEAELSIEREYAHARNVEMQARALLETAPDAVIIADAVSLAIDEANAAAAELLDVDRTSLDGQSLGEHLDGPEGKTLRAALDAAVRERTARIRLFVKNADRESEVNVSFMRREGRRHIVLRLLPPERDYSADRANPALDRFLSQFPEALVVTDAKLNIVAANDAFLDLSGVPDLSRIVGAPLGNLLGEHELDTALLASNLKTKRMVKQFTTILKGWWRSGRQPVSVSAGHTNFGGRETYGFLVRPENAVSRPTGERNHKIRPANEMIDLVGRMPLRDIVRETTGIIEQMCLEAALETTGQNRASAAELLGLSRQGLYSKLNRYGLSGPSPDDA
ncbi:transcriptional regulator PpsR [Pararhizobium mangrovi]|uniref:Transcriptional regulator PpsR n=1 Tax=Pararhizobium mangrovi TaxID=2590452 RepID=A0A506UA68_9HYPH|nr:transcriptional regulator PpsR [Pararhizobium mangrovi]TPW30428.1 transcriptional regulator PpsR [Pararhizobium mangrovi]